MPSVLEILALVEEIAPPRFAYTFDKVGLQVGCPESSVSGIVTTLDCSDECIDFTIKSGANLVISHHPLIFEPLTRLSRQDRASRLCSRLIKEDVALIAAHTNWDCAPGGINDTLASVLGLRNVRALGSDSGARLVKLVTFVPVSDSEQVIEALAGAGAGQIGDYDRCAFVSRGSGTFRGSATSHPVIGKPGHEETVDEARVEMVVPEALLAGCLKALRAVHPYEEPAFDVYPVHRSAGHPIGRMGDLERALSPSDFVNVVEQKLATRCRCWIPARQKMVESAMVVGGAASEEWTTALKAGAGAFVTGEVKHHIAVEARESGLLMIEAGHFETEHPGMEAMSTLLGNRLPSVHVSCFDPC